MADPDLKEEGVIETGILVVGGGTAGVAAAISGAKMGCRTVLVESSEVLGGNASLAFVHTFCGLYLPPKGNVLEFANPGFSSRLALWLVARGGALPPEIHGKVGVLPILPETLPLHLLKACSLNGNLTVRPQTKLLSIQADQQMGFRGLLQTASGTVSFSSFIVIDATGDANAAALLGAETETPSALELQHPTYIFRVGGANSLDLQGYQRLKLSATLNKGARNGQLPPGCDSVLVRPASGESQAFVSLNLPKPLDGTYDPLDQDYLVGLESVAREWALALIDFLRNNLFGWEACHLLEWPRRIGLRETRRVRGLYRIKKEDVLEARRFEDEVANSTWPIELWNRHTGAEFMHPAGPCGIPLRSLISSSHTRLGMAGRCLSGSHEALGAARVMGTCLATGEAIGLASALAVQRGVTLDQIPAQEIRNVREKIHALSGEQP